MTIPSKSSRNHSRQILSSKHMAKLTLSITKAKCNKTDSLDRLIVSRQLQKCFMVCRPAVRSFFLKIHSCSFFVLISAFCSLKWVQFSGACAKKSARSKCDKNSDKKGPRTGPLFLAHAHLKAHFFMYIFMAIFKMRAHICTYLKNTCLLVNSAQKSAILIANNKDICFNSKLLLNLYIFCYISYIYLIFHLTRSEPTSVWMQDLFCWYARKEHFWQIKSSHLPQNS